MFGKFAACAAAIALTIVTVQPAAAQATAPVALSAYGELPDFEDAALSPDGSRLAVLTRVRGERSIVMLDEALQPLKVFAVGDLKVRTISWGGNDHLVVQSSRTQSLAASAAAKNEIIGTIVIPVSGDGQPSKVFGNKRELADATFGNYGLRKVDGRWYEFYRAIVLGNTGLSYLLERGESWLYRVSLDSNKAEPVDRGGSANVSRDWLVGRDGEVAARLETNRNDGKWLLTAGNMKAIARGQAPFGAVYLVALGKDGTSVIYGTRDDEGDSRWYEVPLAGGTPTEILSNEDVERIYVDPLSGNLLGYRKSGGDQQPVMFDPKLQAAATKIRNAFAKYDTQLVDFTPDLGKALIRASGNGDSGTWYLVDVGNLRARAIGYERQAIGPDLVGPISTFSYKAGDGMDLDAILTLPPGRDAKNLPVVMLPHGGPGSADRADFDWWAQAFASRGYAVVQPNFRGSTNRDDAFRRAGFGEWGGKMQTDLSDAIKALAAKGVVDPSRACIVGASYGGYAALAGVTLQKGIYRCAVSVAGVSDLKALYDEELWESGGYRMSKASLLEQLGQQSVWNDRSPRRQAARADAPVLLIHGKDDTVVPYSHTSQMADALRDAHKSVDVVTLASEDHWLSRSETRNQMLEAAVAFVEKHNPPR